MGRRIPDEAVLIEMERRADALIRNHPAYRLEGKYILPAPFPCGCMDCRSWQDIKQLIALVRDLRLAR
jgi:hypothetical protein